MSASAKTAATWAGPKTSRVLSMWRSCSVGRFDIPETGAHIEAHHRRIVVITSNQIHPGLAEYDGLDDGAL